MATQTIGSLVATVRATAGQFGADMADCGKSVDKFQGKLNSAGSGLGGAFLTGGAIGAGIQGFRSALDLVNGTVDRFFSTIERADALADFAQQIGTTANELKGLRFAAEIAGSSADAIDVALNKMIQKLGQAREGNDEVEQAFLSAGLDVDKLAGKSAVEALKDIADAFTQIPNPADQAALAVDLFGKQGASLLNVLRLGRGGIEELTGEFDDLTGSVDTAALEEAKDAITRLTTAWDGLWEQLTVFVAPALSTVFGWFTKVIQGANIVAQAIQAALGLEKAQSDVAKASIDASEAMAEFTHETQEAAKAEADAAKQLDELMKRGAQVAESVRTPLEKFDATINDLNKLLDVGAINWDTYARAVEKANDELDRASETKKNLDRMTSTPGIAAVSSGSSAFFSAIQSANRAQLDAQQKQSDLAQRQLDELKKLNDTEKRIQDVLAHQQDLTGAADI